MSLRSYRRPHVAPSGCFTSPRLFVVGHKCYSFSKAGLGNHLARVPMAWCCILGWLGLPALLMIPCSGSRKWGWEIQSARSWAIYRVHWECKIRWLPIYLPHPHSSIYPHICYCLGNTGAIFPLELCSEQLGHSNTDHQSLTFAGLPWWFTNNHDSIFTASVHGTLLCVIYSWRNHVQNPP